MLTPVRSSAATELRESMMAVTRQMRRHRPDNGLTLSQMQLLGEISRAGVTTPAELGARLQVRVQSLTDSINELVGRDLIARRPDEPTAAASSSRSPPRAPRCWKPTARSATRGCTRRCATTCRSSSSTC